MPLMKPAPRVASNQLYYPDIPTYGSGYDISDFPHSVHDLVHNPYGIMASPPSYGSGYLRQQPVSREEWTEAWQCEQSYVQLPPPEPPRKKGIRFRSKDNAITTTMNQTGAFVDQVGAQLNDMLSRTGFEDYKPDDLYALTRDFSLSPEFPRGQTEPLTKRPPPDQEKPSSGLINFKKSWLYQNSRLPPHMLPFKAYLDTWTLICRAAQASIDVYSRPKTHPGQRECYTDADPKLGTKATIIKAQPIGDRQLIVIAVRGSQKNFVDWAVNFRPAPTAPTGFLDDAGNACHAGFLQVARSMVRPIAAQLQQLITQDPSLATSSLLLTGHSAGGAVASLLYTHMLSAANPASRISSELTDLAGLFKRIHCITFGVPPVSLLPLQKPFPQRKNPKFVFLAFVNEGDPVVRADKAYVYSLARLIAAPAPTIEVRQKLKQKMSLQVLKGRGPVTSSAAKTTEAPYWPVPDAMLSNAGRMVLLREKPGAKDGTVEARQVTDEELRGVIFGDPNMHAMSLYKKRVDEAAFAVLSGSGEA